ncbi:MAG: hypothetical protein FD180_2886 [Planctomycetota bacterium]|nr:MAG: hypothetical protein FD180_2886 [Planctomycetota bacterium]
MKTILLSLALACAALGETTEDGIYLRSEAAEAKKVAGTDGREYGLGEKCAFEIKQARITSQDNANLEFWVSLKVPFQEGLDSFKHVLVVKGKAFGQSGSGSEANTASWINFPVSGKENAEAVAAHFGTKPALRAHPGHQLAVSFIPSRKEFDAGDPKTVTLRIENVGAKTVFFQVGGRNRAARDNQFVFRATNGDKPLPDVGSDAHLGGLSVIRELKPGDVHEQEIDLAKWFAFEKAGTYFVHGSYVLEFFESREYTQVAWEDWATAEFLVRIAEKRK